MSTRVFPSGPSTKPEGRRIHLAALGCKVSRAEACGAVARLSAGPSPPRDVVLVHACTVTAHADRDATRLVRRARREHPDASVVVSGCLAQRDPDGLARLPEVDLVVGHTALPALGELLALREAGGLPSKVAWSAPPTVPLEPDLPLSAPDPDRTRAFVKIQDGCGRRCTFCIVPALRGVERSASPRAVAAEVRRLGEAGVAEVVLTGVHLAAFGHDRGTDLLSLLRLLEGDPPACRVRLSSLEPMEAGDALVTHVAASRVVVPHLHLPLQSGSDRVLRRMRRGLTAARFRALARRALAENPRLHLATDLIAGFPGEDDDDFAATRDLVGEIPFASLHVFPFSPRSGTPAAGFHRARPVPGEVVAARARTLRALGEAAAAAFAARSAGLVADVVALRGGRGLTDNYLEVDLRGLAPVPAPGSRLRVLLLAGAGSVLRAAPPFSPVPAPPC